MSRALLDLVKLTLLLCLIVAVWVTVDWTMRVARWISRTLLR